MAFLCQRALNPTGKIIAWQHHPSSVRHQTPVLGARISLTFKTKDPSFKAKDLKTFKVKDQKLSSKTP